MVKGDGLFTTTYILVGEATYIRNCIGYTSKFVIMVDKVRINQRWCYQEASL